MKKTSPLSFFKLLKLEKRKWAVFFVFGPCAKIWPFSHFQIIMIIWPHQLDHSVASTFYQTPSPLPSVNSVRIKTQTSHSPRTVLMWYLNAPLLISILYLKYSAYIWYNKIFLLPTSQFTHIGFFHPDNPAWCTDVITTTAAAIELFQADTFLAI